MSARASPFVSTGSSTLTSATDLPSRQSCLRSAVAVPLTASGRMGRPASMARRKAPSLNGSISSVSERVPSGKMMTDTFALRISLHRTIASAADRGFPRSTGTSPARRMSHPSTGILKSSALLSHFISQGR